MWKERERIYMEWKEKTNIENNNLYFIEMTMVSISRY